MDGPRRHEPRRLVRAGELTPADVVAQTAAAVERVDAAVCATLEVFDDVVADPHVNGPARDGRLYGVPLFLKDLGSRLAGRMQECGSGLLRGTVSDATDPLVANYLRAGLVPLGRTTTPEFGMTFDTSTAYLDEPKITRNPWNTDRTPGGSSGGSAALVAAGVTPISMSSDGGGSTRIPASYCGLVGLKPSRGRVAMALNQSEYTARHVSESVVTRTVRDSAAALDYLTRKPAGGTFYPMADPPGSFLDALANPPQRLRVALSTGRWGREGECDPQVAEVVRSLARVLEDMQHDVEEVDDADICDWDAMWSGYVTHWVSGRVLYLPVAALGGFGMDELGELLSPMVYRHVEAAQGYATLDLYQAMAANNVVTRTMGEFWRATTSADLASTHSINVPVDNGPKSRLREIRSMLAQAWHADACQYTPAA